MSGQDISSSVKRSLVSVVPTGEIQHNICNVHFFQICFLLFRTNICTDEGYDTGCIRTQSPVHFQVRSSLEIYSTNCPSIDRSLLVLPDKI